MTTFLLMPRTNEQLARNVAVASRDECGHGASIRGLRATLDAITRAPGGWVIDHRHVLNQSGLPLRTFRRCLHQLRRFGLLEYAGNGFSRLHGYEPRNQKPE